MKKLVYTASLLSTVFLMSCSFHQHKANICVDENQQVVSCVVEVIQPIDEPKKPVSYGEPIYFPYLHEYTEQMAYQLKHSLKDIELDGSIAVSNFVLLNESLEESNMLGRQVAELLASDLQNNKLPVSVISLASYIDVPIPRTQQQFEQIEQLRQLEIVKNNTDKKNKNSQTIQEGYASIDIDTVINKKLGPNIQYICTGTLMETKQGVFINAKIIHRHSHQVIASANKTLPYAVLDIKPRTLQ